MRPTIDTRLRVFGQTSAPSTVLNFRLNVRKQETIR
jgi:hypothetical protein